MRPASSRGRGTGFTLRSNWRLGSIHTSSTRGGSSLLVSVSPSEAQEILAYWSGRFGVPGTMLEGLRFLARGKTVWAMADLGGVQETLASFKVEAAGFPLLRKRGGQWKPTTAALLFLEDAIVKNVVELTAERLDPFLR